MFSFVFFKLLVDFSCVSLDFNSSCESIPIKCVPAAVYIVMLSRSVDIFRCSMFPPAGKINTRAEVDFVLNSVEFV